MVSEKGRVRDAIQIKFGSRWCNILTEGSIEYIDWWTAEFVYKNQNVAENERVKFNDLITIADMSRDIRFPTMWYVRPAKAQTSLRIRAV